MARVHPFGWHANIQLDGRELPKLRGADQAAAGQVRDRPHRQVPRAGGAGLTRRSSALLRLVDTGRCWVKLSAPYETSKTGAPKYEDVGRLAQGAGEAGARAHAVGVATGRTRRCRRTSGPPTTTCSTCCSTGRPTKPMRRKILVDNPAELYGF